LETLFQVERHPARENEKARKCGKERWRAVDVIYGFDISLRTLTFWPIQVSKLCPIPKLAAQSVLGRTVELPNLDSGHQPHLEGIARYVKRTPHIEIRKMWKLPIGTCDVF
jgi:hypothetical protein